MLCFALLCFALLCFALLCFALLCFALLCFALPCFALLCLALPCFALLYFALLCFALLCFALLCLALICFALFCLILSCHTMFLMVTSILTSPPCSPPPSIMQAAPPGVLISDICEGKNSYKTFQPIASAFPWDNPKLSKPVPGKAVGSHWSIRRTLMQATASLSQQGGIRSDNQQPPPLLKAQQPQFSNWNKGKHTEPYPGTQSFELLNHTTP